MTNPLFFEMMEMSDMDALAQLQGRIHLFCLTT